MPSFQFLAVAVFPILCYASPINRQVGISENVYMTTQNGTDGLEQRVCSIDAVTYMDGETIPTSSPCEHCVCRPPGFACTITSCEYRPGCKAFRRSDQCCPEYQCECEKDGKIYQNGEKIMDNNNPCEVCYCQGGEIICAVIDCYWRNDCPPRYIDNRCCPMYDHCPPPAAQGPIRNRLPSLTSPITLFNLTQLSPTSEASSSPSPSEAPTTSSTSTTTTTTTTTPVPSSSSSENPEENSVLSDLPVKQPESDANEPEPMNDAVAISETPLQTIGDDVGTEKPVHDDAVPDVQATPTISEVPVVSSTVLESTTIIVPAALELIVQPTNVQKTEIVADVSTVYHDVVAPSSEAPAVTTASALQDDVPSATETERLGDATETVPKEKQDAENIIFSDAVTPESPTQAPVRTQDDVDSSQLLDATAAPMNDEPVPTSDLIRQEVQSDDISPPATTVASDLESEVINAEAVSRNDLPESSTVPDSPSEISADERPTSAVPVIYHDAPVDATTPAVILDDEPVHDDVVADAGQSLPDSSPTVSNLVMDDKPAVTEPAVSNDAVTNVPEEIILNDDRTEAVPVLHDSGSTSAPTAENISFDDATESVQVHQDEAVQPTDATHDDVAVTEGGLPVSYDEAVTERLAVAPVHDEVTDRNAIFDDDDATSHYHDSGVTENIQVFNDEPTEAQTLHVREDDGNVEDVQEHADVEATTRAHIVSDEVVHVTESSDPVVQQEVDIKLQDEAVATESVHIVRDEVVTEGSQFVHDGSVTEGGSQLINDEAPTETSNLVHEEPEVVLADSPDDHVQDEPITVTEGIHQVVQDEPEQAATEGSSQIIHDESANATEASNSLVHDETATVSTILNDEPVTDGVQDEPVTEGASQVQHDADEIFHDVISTDSPQVQHDQATDRIVADEVNTSSPQVNEVNEEIIAHDAPATSAPIPLNRENEVFDIILDDAVIPSQPETLNLVKEQHDIPNRIPVEQTVVENVQDADNDTAEISNLSSANVETTQQPPVQNDEEIIQNDESASIPQDVQQQNIESSASVTEVNDQQVPQNDETATQSVNQNQDEPYNDEPTQRMFRDGLEFLNDHEGVPHESHEGHEDHEGHAHTTSPNPNSMDDVQFLNDHEGVPHENHEGHEDHDGHVHTTSPPNPNARDDLEFLNDHEGVPHENHEDHDGHIHTTSSPNSNARDDLDFLNDHEGVPHENHEGHEDHEGHVHTTSPSPNADEAIFNDQPAPTIVYDDQAIPTTQLPINKVQKVVEALAKNNEIVQPITLGSGELPLHKFRLDLDTFRTSHESLENDVIQEDVAVPTAAAPVEQVDGEHNDEAEVPQVTQQTLQDEEILQDEREQTTQNLLRLRTDVNDVEPSTEKVVYDSNQEEVVTAANSFRSEDITTVASEIHDDLSDAVEGSGSHDEPSEVTETYLRADLEPESATVPVLLDEQQSNDQENEIEANDAVTNSYSFRLALSSEEIESASQGTPERNLSPTQAPQINERLDDEAVTEAAEILQDAPSTVSAVLNDEVPAEDDAATQPPSRFRLDLDLATEGAPVELNDEPEPSTVVPELRSDFIEVSTQGPSGFAQEFHDESVTQAEDQPQNDEAATVPSNHVNDDTSSPLDDDAVTSSPSNDEPAVTSSAVQDNDITNDEVVTSSASPQSDHEAPESVAQNDESATAPSNDDVNTAVPFQVSSSQDEQRETEVVQDEPATGAPLEDEPVTSGSARSGLDELLLDDEVANNTPSNVIFADEAVSTIQPIERLRTEALRIEVEPTENSNLLQDDAESATVLQDEVIPTTSSNVDSQKNESSSAPPSKFRKEEVVLPETGVPKIQPISPDLSRNNPHELRFDLPTEKDNSWLSRAVNQFRRLAGFASSGEKANNPNPQRENTRRFLFF